MEYSYLKGFVQQIIDEAKHLLTIFDNEELEEEGMTDIMLEDSAQSLKASLDNFFELLGDVSMPEDDEDNED